MDKLYKIVNGVTRELTSEEYADIEARKQAKLAEQYKELRASEYGSFEDQLDMIYHGGLDAWKAHIATIKAKYPKPE